MQDVSTQTTQAPSRTAVCNFWYWYHQKRLRQEAEQRRGAGSGPGDSPVEVSAAPR